MPKWEYAEMYFKPYEGIFDQNKYVLVFFKPTGITRIDIKQDKAKGDKDFYDARGRILTQLGIDGWELVAVNHTGIHTNSEILYFKRPLP